MFVFCYHHTDCKCFIWLVENCLQIAVFHTTSVYQGFPPKFASIKIYFPLIIYVFMMISREITVSLQIFMASFLWMEFNCFKALKPLQGKFTFYSFTSWGRVAQWVKVRVGRFLVQTTLGARPGLGTEPHYKAPGDIRVELAKRSD